LRKILPHENNKPTTKNAKVELLWLFSDFMSISGYTQQNHLAHQLQRNLQQAARRLQPAGRLVDDFYRTYANRLTLARTSLYFGDVFRLSA